MIERKPVYVIDETMRQHGLPEAFRWEIIERIEAEGVLRLEVANLRRRVAQLEPHVPEEVRNPPVPAASYVRRNND